MAQKLTPEHVQYLMDNGLRRILRPDPDARHQIVIAGGSDHRIAVSCNCRLTGLGHAPIEVRRCWQPGEAAAIWRRHVAEAEAVS